MKHLMKNTRKLPDSNFLQGGTLHDPLNISGLTSPDASSRQQRRISVIIPSDVHDPLGLNKSPGWTTQKPGEASRKRPHSQLCSDDMWDPSNSAQFESGAGQSYRDVRRKPTGVFDGCVSLGDFGSRQTCNIERTPEVPMEMSGASRPSGRSRRRKSRSRISNREDGMRELSIPQRSNLVPVCGSDAGLDQRSHQSNTKVPVVLTGESSTGISRRARRRQRKLVTAQERAGRDLSTLPAEGGENGNSNVLLRAVPSIDDRLAQLAQTDCGPSVSLDRTQRRRGGGTLARAGSLSAAHSGVRSHQHASWETTNWCAVGAPGAPSRDFNYKGSGYSSRSRQEGDRSRPRRHQRRSRQHSLNAQPGLAETERDSANGPTGRGQKRSSDASPRSAPKRGPGSSSGRQEVCKKAPTEEVRDHAKADESNVALAEDQAALTKKDKIKLRKKQRLARKRAELRAQKAQAASDPAGSAPAAAELRPQAASDPAGSAPAAAELLPPAAPDGSSQQCPEKRGEPATDSAVAEPDAKITGTLDGKPAVLSKVEKLKLKRRQRAAKKRAELRALKAQLASEPAADGAGNSDTAVRRGPDVAVRRDSGGHEDWRCLAAELRGSGDAQGRGRRPSQGEDSAAAGRSSHESGTAVDPGSEAVEKPESAAAEDHDSDGAASRDSGGTQRWDRHVSERRDTESLNVTSAFTSELRCQGDGGTALTKWEKLKLKRKQRRSAKRKAELAASKTRALSEQSGSAPGGVTAGTDKPSPDALGHGPDHSQSASPGQTAENPGAAGSEAAAPYAGQAAGDAGVPPLPAGAAEVSGETSAQAAALTRLERRKAKRRQHFAKRAEELRARKAQATSEASAGVSESSDATLAPPTPALRSAAETSCPDTSPAPGQKRPGGGHCGEAQKRAAVDTEGVEGAPAAGGEPAIRESQGKDVSAPGAADLVNGQPLTKRQRNRLKNREFRARKRAEWRALRAATSSGDGVDRLVAADAAAPAAAPSNGEPAPDRNAEPNDATELLAGSSQPEKTVKKEIYDEIVQDADLNAADGTRAESAELHVLAGSSDVACSDAEAAPKSRNHKDAGEAGEHEGVPRGATSSKRQPADSRPAAVSGLGGQAGSGTCSFQVVSEVLNTEKRSGESGEELPVDGPDLSVDPVRAIVKTEEYVASDIGSMIDSEKQIIVTVTKNEPQKPNDHGMASKIERPGVRTAASVVKSSEEVADSGSDAVVISATDEAKVGGESDASPSIQLLDADRSATDAQSAASDPPAAGPGAITSSGTDEYTANMSQGDCEIGSNESEKQQVQSPPSNNSTTSSTSASSEKDSRRAARYQYGNYDRYYGYRNPSAADPRLAVMREEWFRGRDVLDVGCNIGHITLTLARDFAPRKCVGIDIDASLVKIARKNVRHYVRKPAEASALPPASSEVASLPMAQASTGAAVLAGGASAEAASLDTEASAEAASPSVEASTQAASATSVEVVSPVAGASTEATSPASAASAEAAVTSGGASSEGQFPRNVSFVHGNFVLDSDALLETVRPEYDVILCLSVTKWVHLNFGDAGLRRLLRRMYLMLRPGGRLLLEPQPWSSYAKRRKLTERIAAVFPTLQLRPDQLPAELQQLGFLPPQLLQPPPAAARGFCRPLQLYCKPGGNAAEAKISITTEAELMSTTESERPAAEPAGGSCESRDVQTQAV